MLSENACYSSGSLNFITWIKNKYLMLKLELVYKLKPLTLRDELTLTAFGNGY
jgi:hypothetical protein